MIGVSMPGLPPPVDQFYAWDTEPKIPQHWPGLGSDHRSDGFEIDRRGVKAVAGKQVPNVEITPRWQADGGWLEKQSTVQAYEKAEKVYG
jgi:hypothetical protein